MLRSIIALGAIHGTVRTPDAGAPVSGAQVDVDGRALATTDSLGAYRCAGLSAGYRALRFVAPGYQTREVTVLLADSADLELDVELTPEPVILPNIEVSARRAPDWVVSPPVASDTAPEGGRYFFSRDWQSQLVARDVDVQQALTTLPGVTSRGDGSAGISIRGGTASENLVLLDGIPTFNASHFTSAASAIDPDALAGLDVHTGVSSARFGGRLSGVVELETAEVGSDSVHVTGGFGPTDVRSMVRGPLGSTGGFLVGGRLTFRNLSDDGDGDAGPVASKYRDFIGVARLALAGGALRVISFHGANQLGLERDGSPDLGTAGALDGAAGLGNDIGWQSSSVGATWVRGPSGAPQLRVSVWWAGTSAAIDWLSADGAQQLHSSLSELGAATDLVRPLANGSLGLGASVVRPRTAYSVLGVRNDTTPTFALSAAPAVASLFAEWSSRPSARFAVRAGVRANSDFHRATNLEPRVSLSLKPARATRLDLDLGRTHQTVQSLFNDENVLGALLGLELPIAAGGTLPTASADQLGLGVAQRVGSGLTLVVDGYLRRWTGVIVPAASTLGAFATDSIVAGRGNAAGLVTSGVLERGAVSARVSLGLARSTQWAGADEYHGGYEQPWSVAGTLGYRFALRTVAQLAFTAGAGEATSVVAGGLEWRPSPPAGGGEIGGAPTNLPGPINSARLPGFLRLDLGVRRIWPLAAFGPRGSLLTTLRLVNLLDRANAIGLTANPDGALRVLRGTPRGITFEVGWTF